MMSLFHAAFPFLKMSRFSTMKLMIPETHIARRLHSTTSQPVNLPISWSTPNLKRNTAEAERSYKAKSLNILFFPASGLPCVLSLQT